MAAPQPTIPGYVSTTYDALILFEAGLSGHINQVRQRLHPKQQDYLIRSGGVFIYEEKAAGIKRWTDSVSSSPSCFLGNFLIYHELDKPFPSGARKRVKIQENQLGAIG